MSPDTWMIILYTAGVLGGLALAWAVGSYGTSKGYSFWLCYMLALLTSPFIAWIIIALLPEREHKYKTPPELLLAIELEKAKMKAEQEATT